MNLYKIQTFDILYINYFIYNIFKKLSPNVPAVSDVFFAPDKEKRAAFLRAQKNVAEQNPQRAQARLGFA